MTDTAQPIIGKPPYPTLNLPTIFVDHAVSLFHGSGIVRFYFARSDPDISASTSPNQVPVCQVVIPIVGFAEMTVFFQQQLERMLQNNEIDSAVVNQMREALVTQAVQTPQPQQGQS